MTQLDPHSPTTRPATPGGQPPVKQEPPFNWRVSVGMAIGLAVLFGVLFGLRTLGIFPPRPADDPEIAAVRATLAALPTQRAAPAAQPTVAPAQPAAPAASGAIGPATPVPTNAPPTAAIAISAPTTALTQQASAAAAQSATTGTVFETAPTPVAGNIPDQPNPAVASTPGTSPRADSTQATNATSPSAAPTPVAVNLPANLASVILQSYTNYWNVRLQAIESPSDETIDLESVMAGNELEGARKTLAEMRDNNEAGYSDVKHTIWIVHATDRDAVLVDRYVAQTIKLDPESKAPLESEPTIEQYSDTFQLQNFGGAWKVVREDAGELQ
jgi:hypothetical protein